MTSLESNLQVFGNERAGGITHRRPFLNIKSSHRSKSSDQRYTA
ncbi:hypothetical protein [Christiangramia portivictoriae]|nr:hypothetical protein [Christiangramia portivictoriae]